jgi:hypothetical protein
LNIPDEECLSGWGRKFDEPIALPGGDKLVPQPAAAILTRFKETC